MKGKIELTYALYELILVENDLHLQNMESYLIRVNLATRFYEDINSISELYNKVL